MVRRVLAGACAALLLAAAAVLVQLPAEAQSNWSTKAQQEFAKSLTAASRFGIPRYTTALLPACATANLGALALVTDTTPVALQFCDGTSWLGAAAVGTGYSISTSNGSLLIKLYENAPGASTAALAGLGAGNVNSGTHTYEITCVTAGGETTGGTASNTVTTTGGNGQVALSAIPTCSVVATSRKIYRTAAGGTAYKLLATLSDNTTTTYADNVADASLTTAIPTANTALDTRFTISNAGQVSMAGPLSLGSSYISTTQTAGSTGTTAGLLCKLDSSAQCVTAATSDVGILGIAIATKTSGQAVEVATRGTANCVADNTTVQGNLIGVGTTTAGRCKDLGQTSALSVSSSLQILGRALTVVSAGSNVSVALHGPGHYGSMPNAANATGVLPTANGGTGQNSTATFPASGVVDVDTSTLTLSGAKTFSNATTALGAAGTASTLSFLSTTGPATIQSATAASGGVDVGVSIQTTGDLGSADFILKVGDGASTGLVTADGTGLLNTLGGVTSSGSFTAPVAGYYQWSGRSRMGSSANGLVDLTNSAITGFTTLNLGPTTPAAFGNQVSIISNNTDTTGLLITSNTAASGGVDNGIILRTVGDLGTADFPLLVQDNNGTNLLTLGGAGSLVATGNITATASLQAGGTNSIIFAGKSQFLSSANGKLEIKDNASGVQVQLMEGTAAPTIASGFGTSPSIVGTNVAGRVTVGTGGIASTGAVTFSGTWTNAPICMCNNEVTTLLCKASATTTTLTMSSATPFTAADTLGFHCIGY